MRKIVSVLGVLALAACAQPAEEEGTTGEAAATEEVAEVDPVVGRYMWTEDDGTEVFGLINADGTSGIEIDGEMVSESTWARNEDGDVCITWNDEDTGEEMTDCMSFGAVAEDGTVEVTDSDGNVDTATKVS